MTQDTDDRWGSDPADRWVMVRADIAAPELWHADGASDTVESLPPIPPALARRIEAFADRYDALDGANRQQFPNRSIRNSGPILPSPRSTKKAERSPAR